MSSFHLQIVTPDGSFFDGEANSVVVRTTGGYVSIYPHHTDYIAALDVARAEAAKARAEARIAAATEERDIKLARAKLSRALNRLHIAGK